ncbi:PREDICTED: FAD-dependent oxidoreductase domain-containing protein 2-like [Branchiostoma belcheri]|uniref:FAD-dependent oxidoreductase domain-containing protein 2-like n=1 Tax=Branchiostoma belcheri TaxID=7741 RepID=A0A6P5A093_BRABE|nr:PREDICTED: FAD-dependent oxidoreductase domain-containing protein 2-like [Branchiostoma belcheri]
MAALPYANLLSVVLLVVAAVPPCLQQSSHDVPLASIQAGEDIPKTDSLGKDGDAKQAFDVYHDYLVIGAGPSGLQMGFYLERAGRDYLILERGDGAGTFYKTYPRHRKLISINKRNTGKTNKEFNMRHDWNSLLSDDDSLQIRHYSKEFFPQADILVQYLHDYATKLKLKVQYSTDVKGVSRVANHTAISNHLFILRDQNNRTYACQTLIVATGVWVPNVPDIKGLEHTVGYEDMSLDPDDYEGKTVLILGRGNSAFETADHIMHATNLIHMFARSRVRLSWATHYVGDLRAINNGLLDTYQLKSLDAVLEANVEKLKILNVSGKLYLDVYDDDEDIPEEEETERDPNMPPKMPVDNFAVRDPYDVIIRALGFKFDNSIFDESTAVEMGRNRKSKYPTIKHNYESSTVPGMFFAGTCTHSLDFRKSAGGFIHGFRYTARAMSHLLEWRNHGVPWPSVSLPTTQLLSTIVKRLNEGSGFYQMFSVLGDIIILKNGGTSFAYLEEFPIRLLPALPKVAGHDGEQFIVVALEYGKNFSGPGKDIFRSDRATGEASDAHNSNFLHPVFYHYNKLPTEADMLARPEKWILPRPNHLHHTVEDFLTSFTAPKSHILPIRRFLETSLDTDLRNFFAESCFKMALKYRSVPQECEEHYLQGQGLMPTANLYEQAVKSGLLM